MTETPPDPQQPQYGQPQYGQPQYGQPQYGQPQFYAPPTHGSSTTALILGILGLVLCPLALSIPALVIGRRAVKEIDASHGQLGGRGNAQAGYILGIIGTIWGAITLLFVIGVFALGGLLSNTFDDSCTTIDEGSGFTTQC